MDIFSHALWTGAAYKAVNKKFDRKLNVLSAAFWGIFPDLFAFTIPFAWIFYNLASGHIHISDLPHPRTAEPPQKDTMRIFSLASSLYNISHSIFIFAAIFIVAWLLFRRPVWELGGWLLHILIDIPTHTYQFFPTPIFWPVSSFKFSGFSWADQRFVAIDIISLIIVYWLLYKNGKINSL